MKAPGTLCGPTGAAGDAPRLTLPLPGLRFFSTSCGLLDGRRCMGRRGGYRFVWCVGRKQRQRDACAAAAAAAAFPGRRAARRASASPAGGAAARCLAGQATGEQFTHATLTTVSKQSSFCFSRAVQTTSTHLCLLAGPESLLSVDQRYQTSQWACCEPRKPAQRAGLCSRDLHLGEYRSLMVVNDN